MPVTGTPVTSSEYDSTISSGDYAYCTVAQFIQRVDARTVQEWMSDTGTALTSVQLSASTELSEILKESSAEVEAFCLACQRYTPEDLEQIYNSDSNAGRLLIGVVAGLTLGRVWARRPRTAAEPFPTLTQWARNILEQLRQGIAVFGLLEHQEAGVLSHTIMTPAEVVTRRLATYIGHRYFGRRTDRDVTDRG